MTLPTDIEQVFFDTLIGDKSVAEFEQWLYAEKELETILHSDDYLELISYGYKADNAKFGLFKLLEKHVDKAKLETRRFHKLLTKALNRDKELPEILVTFYDLYCKGYSFFDNLGFGYGIIIKVPEPGETSANAWSEVKNKEQKELLDSFYPNLETEIKKVISWLDTGKVILTGTRDEYNWPYYIDNRTELEKRPTAYKAVTIGSTTQKPWWKFW